MTKIVQSATSTPESPWQLSSALSRETTRAHHLTLLCLAISGLFILYWSTLLSMISIWWRSDTFAHGFFILPISLFLIWRKRSEIGRITMRIDFRALAALVAFGFLWMLADTVDVLVVKQYAFVAMIPAIVWLIAGWPMLKSLAFPLAYLLLAVPVGEGLILPMMKMTAAFTVHAVQLSGVPVYWEGFYLTLPSGSWNIVEGCSGVRYLIASVTVGILYAYLTYRSLWRRIAFVSLSIAFPVVANWLRAYMIVMIGHVSEMKLATGVDHLIYGWVFFGIVMMILFWLGSFWRENTTVPDSPDGARSQSTMPSSDSMRIATVGLVAGLLVLGLWPLLGAHLTRAGVERASFELTAPRAQSGWRPLSHPLTDWKPQYVNATSELESAYASGRDAVGMYLAYYSGVDQGAELVNSQNVMVQQKHPVWREPYQRAVSATISGRSVEVVESELESSAQAFLIWHWYWVAGQHTANPYEAKMREAIARIFGGDSGGVGIVVFTPRDADRDASRAVLQRFLDGMITSIETSIETAAKR